MISGVPAAVEQPATTTQPASANAPTCGLGVQLLFAIGPLLGRVG